MTQIFYNLYSTLLNPFSRNEEDQKLDYFEILGISWALHIIYAFYSIFAVLVGVKTYEYLANSSSLSQMVYGKFNITLQKFSIVSGISEAIFYPIVFHFSYKFWLFLLKFYGQVFNSEIDVEENSEDILTAIYASNVFLIFPIFGKVLSYLAQIFYLYKGLLKKLKFNNLQAILVLMTPVFIMFIFSMLVVSYFVFLISLI